MISQPVRELRKHVRGGRGDEQQVGAISELDVTRPPVFLFVEEGGNDGIFGKRLQGERRDELGCILRHDDKKVVALFHEQAGQLGGLVSGDRAGDAEHDCPYATTQAHDFARAGFVSSHFRTSLHARSAVYSRICCRGICQLTISVGTLTASPTDGVQITSESSAGSKNLPPR